MEKLRAKNLHSDLCAIYQGEIRSLSKEVEALQLKNMEIKQHYEAVISAEEKNKEAMRLEIQELKAELQRADASTVEALSQQLEETKRKCSAERLMLLVVEQEMEDLKEQLQREKVLRIRAETDKLEAVEIAEALFHEVEELQSVSEERSAESQLLSAELKSEKSKKDQLHHEILELQQMLREEQDLRSQVDADCLMDFELVEAVCKELDHQLQRGSSKLDTVKIWEMFEKLEEARTVSEKLTADSQKLADKLREDGKKQETQVQDIVTLIHMLDTETILNVQAENHEMEAIKVLEVLQQRLDREMICQDEDFL